MKNGLDGGDAILDALRRSHVDYIIASPGSEWPPVWEALAKQERTKTEGPAYIDCWHETLAVNIAMGYTSVTGRPQVVLLHAAAGLFQGSIAVRGALLAEIPMLVMSGESLAYGTDPDFDPGEQWYRCLSIVGGPQRHMESITKWSTQVNSPFTLHESVVRAFEMSQRNSKGPIYLNVPLEMMLEPWSPSVHVRDVPPAPITRPEARDINDIVQLLIDARNPIISTSSIGGDPNGLTALVELAELLGAPVLEGTTSIFANFPKDHPLHLGFELDHIAASADVVLLAKDRSPWYPPHNRPVSATIVSIDDNPLPEGMAYQDMQADRYLEGDAVTTLRLITAGLRAAGVSDQTHRDRRELRAREHDAMIAGLRAAEDKVSAAARIDPLTLCAALRETMPADAVYADETTVHRGMLKRHIPWNEPQTYFNLVQQSGLGQGLGMALGVKLAMPGRTVVALMGDGAFLYNPVLPCLGASKAYDLPMLIVIFNNMRYQAMQNNHKRSYPDGECVTNDRWFGVHIEGPDYAEAGKPFGIHGETVTDPKRLTAALCEALAIVEGGTTAIVNVMVSR